MNALEIEHLTKRYGSTVAVDDISFSIKKGEFFGFLGRNGAGKSSTIHCVTGIGMFQEGDIRVFGTNVRESYREARYKIGLSPQEFNVDIFATPDAILWHVGGYYGLPKQARRARIEELLKRFDLIEHRKKQFRALSGGLKRRVLLARAMIHDPELLILDEPTAGVDVELRRDLWAYLREINAQGKTILLTSHYLEEVEQLCSRIAVIDRGKIVAIDSKDALVSNGETLEQNYLRLIGA